MDGIEKLIQIQTRVIISRFLVIICAKLLTSSFTSFFIKLFSLFARQGRSMIDGFRVLATMMAGNADIIRLDINKEGVS
jgi:hypothetical protein